MCVDYFRPNEIVLLLNWFLLKSNASIRPKNVFFFSLNFAIQWTQWRWPVWPVWTRGRSYSKWLCFYFSFFLFFSENFSFGRYFIRNDHRSHHKSCSFFHSLSHKIYRRPSMLPCDLANKPKFIVLWEMRNKGETRTPFKMGDTAYHLMLLLCRWAQNHIK